MGENFTLACPICKTALVSPDVSDAVRAIVSDVPPEQFEAAYEAYKAKRDMEDSVFFPGVFLLSSNWCPGCDRSHETHSGVIDLFPLELQDTPYLIESYRYDRIVDKGQEDYSGLEETHPDKRAAFIKETLEAHGMTGYVNIGPGFGTLEKATEGMDRLAIDLCWGFLGHLKAVCPEVAVVRGVAEHLPLLTGSVKCLVADSTFQVVVDREKFLYEIARVTTYGSLLIMSIAYKWNYPRRPQNGFNVLQTEGIRVLRRFIHELGFDVEFTIQDIATGDHVEAGNWVVRRDWRGDYLWIIGQKTR